MNITMLVLNNFVSDARVHKEAQSLSTAGHEVQVLALHRPGLPVEEQAHGYRIRRLVLKSRAWQGGGLAPLVKYVELARRVAQATSLRPADVYHSHDGNTLLATYPVVARDRALWVYDSHELETGRNFGGSHLAALYRWLWPLPERLFIRRANAVISASPSYAEQLVKTYGIPTPNVIMNCPPYRPPLESSRLRDELNIPAEHAIALYQGGLLSNRGIEACIECLRYLEPSVELAVLGNGPARSQLEKLAAHLGLSQRVHFLGHIPLAELLDYTASADVGLSLIQNTCPSYYYTLPNKIFEYLMAGLPIVASDFPAMRGVVHDHQVGEVVSDPSNPQEVAAAIRRLLDKPERYRQVRLNTRQAAKVFNWENEQKKLYAVYEQLERQAGEQGLHPVQRAQRIG